MNPSRLSTIDARDAYSYAKRVGHRIPGLEHIILRSPYWSRTYAIDVIRGRWPVAENTINEGSIFVRNSYWAMVNGVNDNGTI